MNELLLSEIKSDEKDLLRTCVLIEEFVFASTTSPYVEIDEIVKRCQVACVGVPDPLDRAELMINELYIKNMFIDNNKSSWPVLAFQVKNSIDYRVISPCLKAAIICHIIKACDIEADIVFVPEKVMVRVICDETYAIIFDPVTGESLDWQALDIRMDELEGDPSQFYLDPMDHITLIGNYLSGLKNALIKEGDFDCALKCVDILIALHPDDPFERRDRGFLLHQLDCFKVAYDDYQYFVQQCPKDPAAQLLKLQLDNITIAATVLH